jgi:ABC-type proline/glycine betaine transport system permease subunit
MVLIGALLISLISILTDRALARVQRKFNR